MHRVIITVDRGLCIVLTLIMGVALFATEACMGVRAGASPSVAARSSVTGHRGAHDASGGARERRDRAEPSAVAEASKKAIANEELVGLQDDAIAEAR